MSTLPFPLCLYITPEMAAQKLQRSSKYYLPTQITGYAHRLGEILARHVILMPKTSCENARNAVNSKCKKKKSLRPAFTELLVSREKQTGLFSFNLAVHEGLHISKPVADSSKPPACSIVVDRTRGYIHGKMYMQLYTLCVV